MKKEETQKLHLFLVLVLDGITKDSCEYEEYLEYYNLNLSPLDNTLTKKQHLLATDILMKIILTKLDKIDYFKGKL